jgi:hypothetical protein
MGGFASSDILLSQNKADLERLIDGGLVNDALKEGVVCASSKDYANARYDGWRCLDEWLCRGR